MKITISSDQTQVMFNPTEEEAEALGEAVVEYLADIPGFEKLDEHIKRRLYEACCSFYGAGYAFSFMKKGSRQ